MTDFDSLTQETKRVFLAYAKDAGNWNGTPLVDGSKAERGNLTHLKRAGLVETFVDDGHKWLTFTEAGKAVALANGITI